MSRIRKSFDVELPLRALFEAPTVAQLSERVEKARQERSGHELPPLIKTAREGPLPLSFAQQRLWFLDQLEPGNPLYNIPQALRIRGALDVGALEQSLAEIVHRHEALRTRFELVENQPAQVISERGNVQLPTTDLRALAGDQRDRETQRLIAEEAALPFDLSQGPLFRARLFRLGPEEHLLVLCIHHVVSDRWSMGVMAEEMAALYSAFAAGKPSPLPELAIQYADFAVWQRSWLHGAALDQHLSYWKRQLTHAPAVLELPSDRTRPAVQSFRGATASRVLPQQLVARLTELSRSEGVTVFMTLLAAFQTLLSRYSGQEDIVVGSPIANRNHAEIEPLIGFFVNTLALRTDLAGDPTFRTLLARLKETALQAYAHQDLPFEKLVEELQSERSLSHNPIFQAMFALQNAPWQLLPLQGLQVERVPVYTVTSMFDMSWFVIEVPDGLMVRAEYSTDLFDESTITRALQHFENLLEAAVEHPEWTLWQLPLLGEDEKRKVLAEFNDTQADFPPLCIHHLLEQTAKQHPEATALISGSEQFTYRELNERANKIARYLVKLGAGRESLVGVFMERTADLVPAIFGVLKAGSAYVPLDSSYPRERLKGILQDSQAKIVLTQQSLAGQLENDGTKFVCLDSEWGTINGELGSNANVSVSPNDLAYVLFTSGSTGRPKGVALEHRNNVTFVQWAQTVFTPDELSGVLFCTSVGFDMSTFEMFLTVAAGGKIILAENALYLPALPAKNEVTLINTVPSVIAELLQLGALPGSVRTVALAGEVLPNRLAEELYRTDTVAKVYNLYGPTESGYSTWTLVPRSGPVTIGRPIANEQCYILDRRLNPAPVGTPGELYLAGEGLARGYLGRPDLTAERFVANPFAADRDRRMYRTGDLCRWLESGEIEYLGRIDNQVKLRGFRIELGEIEGVLGRHPKIRQCTVMAREDQPGLKRLVAYIASGDPPATEELLAHVSQCLPEFMVPSAFVIMASLPLTFNGKIDRRGLPVPEYIPDEQQHYIAPRNSVEKKIAAIWGEVLHREDISAEADFFASGGHSLLAAQVISRLRLTFDVEIPVRAIFESPRLDVLASRIQSARPGLEIPPIRRVSRQVPLPPSFAQQRLWFLDQLDPNSPVYNIAYTLKITGPINADAIESSLNVVATRHESLRTSFASDGGQPVQIIHDTVRVPFRNVDLSSLDASVREAEARRLIAEDANRAIDLTQAPLLRAMLLRLSEDEHYLLINIHHIVSDRWSMGILSRELGNVYERTLEGRLAELSELPLQYADYAVWQREWLKGDVLEGHLAYWKTKLQDAPPLLELPTDRPRQATESFRGEVADISLPANLAKRLNELSQRQGVTLFMTLLGAFQALLSRYSGQNDVVVGTAIANRSQPELENVIGFFLNTLPLRTKLSGDPTFAEIISRAKETALGAYAHQDLPFEKLVEELRPERNLSHSPLVQVFFVLQNAPADVRQLEALGMKAVPSGIKTVKGDLYLSMAETADGLEGRLEYNTDLFDAATAERLLGVFRVMLEAVASNSELRLSQIPLLSQAERTRILTEWNATDGEYPRTICTHQLFEQQVERDHERIAVTFGAEQISYGELNRRSNQLARHLRTLGVGPDTLVGIFLERSPSLLVALLGVLKASGAYVPLDPAYPKDRIAFILEDAGVTALLSEASLVNSLPANAARLLCIDSDWDSISKQSDENLPSNPSPRNLAYVLYTSGSTGKPKGVQIEHRNLVNFLASVQKEPGLNVGDRLLAVTTLSFDIAGLEIYLPLICGAQIVLASRDEAADGTQLLALMNRANPSVMQATPATWRMLVAARWSGSPQLKVLCGGEALPPELTAELVSRCGELWNMYGPTETTIWSSLYRVRGSLSTTVPIGRPMANTTMYVLDPQRQPLPVGVAGEIYIGGDGLARGYYKRPELTAEKFIADPFSSKPGARLYRTGDLAKYLSDGNLQYLGRTDFQVKLRGFRIELGEIEAALEQHPAVRQAVVVVHEDRASNDRRLVAYVVFQPGEQLSSAEARVFLKQSLPDYMVPGALVGLDSLPLTPNGKVDRKALAQSELARSESALASVAPRTAVEEAVAGIWAEILRLPQVGAHEDFFALGGHSLLATQVMSRIRQVCQIELPLRVMFEAPTVAGIAQKIEQEKREGQLAPPPPILPVLRDRNLPLSFAQQRLWFLDQLQPENPMFNIPQGYRLTGELDVDALRRALGEIVRRHEVLRTTFATVNDEPVQVIGAPGEVPLALTDLSHLPAKEQEEEMMRLVREDGLSPFNLARDLMMRASLIRLSATDHVLLLNIHHIAGDGWSLGTFMRELCVLYKAFRAGERSPLPELPIQYADYAVWQRRWLQGEALANQLAYWRKNLEGVPPVLDLRPD